MDETKLIENPSDIKLARNRNIEDSIGKPSVLILLFGPTMISILVVLLIVLLWLIKYPDIIISDAIITTSTPPQKKYARTSGKIDTIFVKENQFVYPGMPLAVIENSANFKDVFYLKSLLEKINSSSDFIYFPSEKTNHLFLGEVEEAFSRFKNTYNLYKLNEKLKPFANEFFSGQLVLQELNERLESLNSQNQIYESEIVLKQKELDRYKLLLSQGAISDEEFENKQLDYYQAKRNSESINLTISQLKESKSNNSKSLKSIEINGTKEEIQLFNLAIQAFHLLKKAIKDWELKYVLQADIEGRISILNYWNENQSVNEGDLLFTIIPFKKDSFIAKLKTPPKNSGKIKLGQDVNIKLENYSSSEFGVIKGKLSSISQMPDQDGFYLINVTLNSNLITTYKKRIDFKQEMKAKAEIITEDLRLIERIFYRLRSNIE